MANAKPKPRKLGRGLNSLLQPKTTSPSTTVGPEPHPSASHPDLNQGMKDVVGIAIASEDSQRKTESQEFRARHDTGTSTRTSNEHEPFEVDITALQPSPFQPRRVFSDTELSELADSVREHGVLQPIIIRTFQRGRFELIAGERRWRAAQMAGLRKIPAILRDCTDDEAASIALIENIQRADLNPIERARALRMLGERFNLTHQQIADRVSLDRATVSNLIRITELEDPILDMLANGKLTTGHAKALLSTPPGPSRARLAERCIAGHWSVRKIENEIRSPAAEKQGSSVRPGTPNADIASLEQRLTEYLGSRVTLRAKSDGTQGELRIAFNGLDHFDGLLERIGFRLD